MDNELALEQAIADEDVEVAGQDVVQADLPIFLVGLGGVGTAAVAQVLRRIGGLDRNPNIAAICIDTTTIREHMTRGRMPWIRDYLTEGSTYVNITDSKQFHGGLPLREWRRFQKSQDHYEELFGWDAGVDIPDVLQQFGAGAVRQVGRLAFARAVQDGWLRARIASAMDRLTAARPGGTIVDGAHAGALMTVVVAGMAGGTGSGSFIDTVALLHDIRHQSALHQLFVRGMLAAPSAFMRLNNNKARLAENSYALLKELDSALRSDPAGLREIVLPRPLVNMADDMDGRAFMSNVYLVDDVVPGVRHVGSIQDMHAVMAQALYSLTASVAGGSSEASENVNGAGSAPGKGGRRTAYSTIGSGRALLPRESLVSHCARLLIVDLVDEVLLSTPDYLSATMEADFEKKGSLYATYDALLAPKRQMDKVGQRVSDKIAASADAHDTNAMAKDEEFAVGLKRVKNDLVRQVNDSTDRLRKELQDAKMRGIADADSVLEGFVNGCDQGLVYAREAIVFVDGRLEGVASGLRGQLENQRAKPDPRDGIVHSRSAELEKIAERAAKNLVVSALGRVMPGYSKGKIAEEYVSAVCEELIAQIKTVVLEYQRDYVCSIAARSTLEGAARDDVLWEATEHAEMVVRSGEKQLRARRDFYEGRSQRFDVEQAEGGLTPTTAIYPEYLRNSLENAEPLRGWYAANVRKSGASDRLADLAVRVLGDIRTTGSGLYSWGSNEDAVVRRARKRLLSAAKEAVRPLVEAQLPLDLFAAIGRDPADAVRQVVLMASPTIEANSPANSTPTSTACVFEPARVNQSRRVDSTELIQGGSPCETLVLDCLHGHLLDSFPRVEEWRTAYGKYLANPTGDAIIPIHLNDEFRKLPEPMAISLSEMPAEVFESFVKAQLFDLLVKGYLSESRPRDLGLKLRGVEMAPIETLGDLPPIIQQEIDQSIGWTLAAPTEGVGDLIELDVSAKPLVLGASATAVVESLSGLPASTRECVNRLYQAALKKVNGGGHGQSAAVETMQQLRERIRKIHDSNDRPEERVVWERMARELDEEIEALQGLF